MASLMIVDSIGFINITNPPLNALNLTWKEQFPECLKSALENDEVSAIVLCGEGRSFSVGADITEFHLNDGRGLNEFIDLIERCSKPVVAAVHGYALGGGLEIALACHYRIALSNAKFGFPEVKIGLLPAAGGTQRFPRLVGLQTALEWIVHGEEYSAANAYKIGLVDKVYPDSSNIQECAKNFVVDIVKKDLSRRMLSRKQVPDANQVDILMKKYQDLLRKKSRGALAPLACLECTCQSAKLSYEVGMAHEQSALSFLQSSGQIQALTYVFFAERFVRKWSSYIPGLKNIKARKVDSIAVIGLGTMGRGIAISLLRSGFQKVLVLELNEKALVAGVDFIRNTLKNDVKKGRISDQQREAMEKFIVPVQDYGKLHDADVVIEAVFESMPIKKEVFAKLDRVCKPSTILASNTSALDIDEIASATSRPQQVIGMHFFAPAHIMRLLENVRGTSSSAATIATAMTIGEKLKKVTTLVGNCRGFVGNRMMHYYSAEGEFLLDDGAYPEQIDRVLREFGFAMGRFQVADLSGNDIGYRMRSRFGVVNKNQPTGRSERERFGRRYCALADILVESGRLGYKSDGKGWFTYVGKERKLRVDPAVTKMIDDYRARNNIAPRHIADQEIIERMLYPMINEGFKILEDGIADHPTIIDLIWIHGYAWPRHTGGPMYYAHTVGLPRVLNVIERHWKEAGEFEPHWEPSSMLKRLVKEHGNPDVSQWMQLTSGSSKSSL